MSYQSAKNERKHKFKAVLATIAVTALITAAVIGDGDNLQEYLPDVIVEWFSDEAVSTPVEKVAISSDRP